MYSHMKNIEFILGNFINFLQVNCSGHGQCRCGKCLCDSFYEGDICESCPVIMTASFLLCDHLLVVTRSSLIKVIFMRAFIYMTYNLNIKYRTIHILKQLQHIKRVIYTIILSQYDKNESEYSQIMVQLHKILSNRKLFVLQSIPQEVYYTYTH